VGDSLVYRAVNTEEPRPFTEDLMTKLCCSVEISVAEKSRLGTYPDNFRNSFSALRSLEGGKRQPATTHISYVK
jgi:hypothetical protein